MMECLVKILHMKAIKILKEKINKRIVILIENETYTEVDYFLFKSVMFPKEVISVQAFDEWFEAKSYKIAYVYAMRLLAKKGYLSTELANKLREKRFVNQIVDKIVEQLQKEHFIQDEKLISRQIEKLLQKGYGPFYIAEYCKQKKISGYAPILDQMADLSMQRQAIKNYAAKYLKELNNQQKISKLIRRGFETSLVYDVIRSLHDPHDEEMQSHPEYFPYQ